jgi:hypothetical protein
MILMNAAPGGYPLNEPRKAGKHLNERPKAEGWIGVKNPEN